MTEDFLHYAWKTLSFRTQGLRTRQQETVRILDPGIHNRDQGPDFLHARIRIGAQEFSGQVELHLHGEEWFRHGHHRDPLYNAVVLHVVFEKGKDPARRLDGTVIPELVIGTLLDGDVRQRYEDLQHTMGEIPCQNLLNQVPQYLQNTWMETLLRERLRQKAETALMESAESAGSDWGQGYWRMLASHFGGIVNGESFRVLAGRIPHSVIRKNAENPDRMEALLLGGSGLLGRTDLEEAHEQQLQAEWAFLRQKYQLDAGAWLPLKYLRMRPAAFPDIRLAQLAAFLCRYPDPGNLMDIGVWQQLLKKLPEPADYWKTRHRLGVAGVSKGNTAKAGREFATLLLVNVVIPLTLAYRAGQGRAELTQAEWDFIRKLPAEKNRITRLFEQAGAPAENAGEAQAQIQLYKHYCLPRKCLSCAIGKFLIGGKNLTTEYLMEP